MGHGKSIKDPEKKQGLPRSSVGPWNEYVEDDCGGICKNCGEYEQELVDGFCREEDCKHDRMIKAFIAGYARKLPDGTIVVMDKPVFKEQNELPPKRRG